MGNERSPTDELQALVEQFGAQDRNTARAAQIALASTGEAEIASVIWGLSHPNVRVRRGCAAFLIITVPTHILSHCGRWRSMIPLPPFAGWLSILRVARNANNAP